MKKVLVLALSLLVIAGYVVYQSFFAPTKIAMVNYPDFLFSKMVRVAHEEAFEIDNIETDELPDLSSYDMAFIFGMGLKLTEQQVHDLQETGKNGLPMYLQASTTKDLHLTFLSDTHKVEIQKYLYNGGSKNYLNMFRYIRAEIDQKSYGSVPPEKHLEIGSNVLFHKDQNIAIKSVKEFEKYCLEQGIHKAGNKKLLLFTSIPGPFSSDRTHLNDLITELESRNFNLYPVAGFRGRLDYLKEIRPDLIVYMPHGRLSLGGGSSKEIVGFLKHLNAPILCPLTVHQKHQEWLKDKQGMMGGLMSQSVTMPEFDGGITPYAVFTKHELPNGLIIFKAQPDRLKNFGELAQNYARLQTLENKDKKLAFVYFKGPGKNALTAADMEVLPSLHNVLLHLQKEGYNLGDLPKEFKQFKQRIMLQGVVLGPYAEGAFEEYLKNGNPHLIPVQDYENWSKKSLPQELITDVQKRYGKAPGSYMGVYQNEQEYLAVARVQFGNVVVLPQPMPGLGDNSFALVHGAKVAPPHSYIAPYLWIQHGFQADAIFHFGTHGSAEFTPGKQIALSNYDWTDPLVGTTPHNYIYTIGNIGEAMIAKRRSYAVLQSHLTPPFMKAEANQSNKKLLRKLTAWENAKGAVKREYALTVKQLLIKEGIHQELELDSLAETPYSDEQMGKIMAFLAELEDEKVTAGLYTIGEAYEAPKLAETSKMMQVDALAHSLAMLDLQKGKITPAQKADPNYFRKHYLMPSEKYTQQVLKQGSVLATFNQLVSKADKQRSRKFERERRKAKRQLASRKKGHKHGKKASHAKGKKSHPHGKKKGHPHKTHKHKKGHAHGKKNKPDAMTGATPKMAPADPTEEAFSKAVQGIRKSLQGILAAKSALAQSPQFELQAVANTLNGGYIAPSAGGDPIGNPESVPTGKNLYSINAEQTPTPEAWAAAKKLGDQMLADYKQKHGRYPKKVSFTLWGGSFIESEGANIGQVLYMLGVEPIWTPRGKVQDLRLIPESELGRPRIDVLVQTSGQARDLAASRLFLLNKAVKMAAEAEDSHNFVQTGVAETEQVLIDKGFSPKKAKEMATWRVFGGVNGNYGTAIMGMVEQGNRWDERSQIAKTYLNNMGAAYGTQSDWGSFNKGLFEAAMQSTEVVMQPRHSNMWGALSLDHVYEFMGGLNLAVKEVTGAEPEAYFNDFRNTSNPRIQGLKEAIGVESRTTLLNPKYIKERFKGGASSADAFAEIIRNTYGWNVMKPSVIENRLWDDLYDTYVLDKKNLGVKKFFKRENPYAFQEMTAVMLETVRKGMWKATPEQIDAMSKLHAQLVREHEAGCSEFVCDNNLLRSFIKKQLTKDEAKSYQDEIKRVREASAEQAKNQLVLKKQEKNREQPSDGNFSLKANKLLLVLLGVGLVLFMVLISIRNKRRRKR